MSRKFNHVKAYNIIMHNNNATDQRILWHMPSTTIHLYFQEPSTMLYSLGVRDFNHFLRGMGMTHGMNPLMY